MWTVTARRVWAKSLFWGSPGHRKVESMAKQDRPVDNARVKIRVLEFEVEGGNATILDGIKQLETVIQRGPGGAVRQARTSIATMMTKIKTRLSTIARPPRRPPHAVRRHPGGSTSCPGSTLRGRPSH
jgi:hypothetical protein